MIPRAVALVALVVSLLLLCGVESVSTTETITATTTTKTGPVHVDYCGVQLGTEYELPVVPASQRLALVQVVTRHGARTPYQAIPGDRTVWHCQNTQLAIDDVQPQQSARHVDRLYRKRFPSGREFLAGNCSLGR
jgi:hypothetical protein